MLQHQKHTLRVVSQRERSTTVQPCHLLHIKIIKLVTPYFPGMPVRCRKVLVQHQHNPAATATLLQAPPHPKSCTILNFVANGSAEMGLKILYLHLLLRQMQWLAEIHTTAFHQLRGSFKRWSCSCLLPSLVATSYTQHQGCCLLVFAC